MGGAVCLVHRNAVLRFEEVPTSPHDLVQFDQQIRDLYNVESIAQAVVDAGKWQDVCDALAKHAFSQSDRTMLYNVIESLYEEMSQTT